MESTTNMHDRKKIKIEPMTEDVCSVCSETSFSFEKLAGNEELLQQLTFLIIRIDTNSLQNTLICRKCSERIKEAYTFKKSYTENFCRTITDIKTDMEIFCICEICKNIAKKSSAALLLGFSKELKNIIFLIDGLQFYTSDDAQICISCQESLLNFNDIMNLLCVNDENKLYNSTKYLIKGETSNNGQLEIEMDNLTEHTNTIYQTSSVNHQDIIEMPIKKEINFKCEENQMYEEFICKNEEVDLKTDSYSGEHEVNVDDMNTEDHSTSNRIPQHWEEDKLTLSNLATEYFNLNSKDIDENEDKKFFCYICEFRTKYSSALRRHMTCHQVVDEKALLSCEICEYKTRHKAHLKQHAITHKNINEIETFSCEFCDYKVKRKGNLKKHIMQKHKTTDEIVMYKCESCEYKAKTKANIKQHIIFTHKNIDEVEVFACNICGHKSKTKGCLKQHMLIHKDINEIKIFKCEFCEYKAKRKDHLQSHILIHKSADEIQMFKCDSCKYQAKRKDLLKLHMLGHKTLDEIKTFDCHLCSYKTRRKGHLRGHLLTHQKHDTEMFKCSLCEYTTKLRKNLKGHMIVHKSGQESSHVSKTPIGQNSEEAILIKKEVKSEG